MIDFVTQRFLTAAHDVQVLVAIGTILIVGALAGRIVQTMRLPTVTGYIGVGILIGPYGLGIITHEMITGQLRVFADIALMIIAFSIGKMIDFRFTKIDLRRPIIIPAAEAFGAFMFVLVAMLLLGILGIGHYVPAGYGFIDYILPMALLLATIAMATAPGANLAIVKEYGRDTLLTRCMMMSIAVDNALAIAVFGIVAVILQDVLLLGTAHGILPGVLLALGRILGAVCLGALMAILLHPFIERQDQHGPTLMITLGMVLLCAGLAELLNFPPLLAGITLGVVITNSYRCERGAFEAIEKFEPPLFAIFFVLAGAHFDFDAFGYSAVAIVVYILARMLGKFIGTRVATRSLRVESCIDRFLGLTLVSQAGIAIGLVLRAQSIPAFEAFWVPLNTIILTAVAISEIIGPPLTFWSLHRSGEYELDTAHNEALDEHNRRMCKPDTGEELPHNIEELQ